MISEAQDEAKRISVEGREVSSSGKDRARVPDVKEL